MLVSLVLNHDLVKFAKVDDECIEQYACAGFKCVFLHIFIIPCMYYVLMCVFLYLHICVRVFVYFYTRIHYFWKFLLSMKEVSNVAQKEIGEEEKPLQWQSDVTYPLLMKGCG